MIAGIIALLTGTFAVGSLVVGIGGHEEKADTRGPIIHNQADTNPAPPAETGTIAEAPVPQQPMQPLPGAIDGSTIQNGNDQTAMSAQQYAQVMTAPPAMTPQPAFTGVDPRTITSMPAVPQAPKPVAPKPKPAQRDEERSAPIRVSSHRTSPRPIEQPLPGLDEVSGRGTVSLNLTVGENGRVREIEILKGAPGLTSDVVDAVRHWRFEPATEDGQRVEGQFKVDISFNGND